MAYTMEVSSLTAGAKSGVKASAASVSLTHCRELFLAVPGFWWRLLILGVLWFAAALLQYLSLSLHGVLCVIWYLCLLL